MLYEGFFYFKVTQNGEIPRGKTVSDSSELMLSLCLVLFKARILSIFWISIVFFSYSGICITCPKIFFLLYSALGVFFLITDWSKGIFFRDINRCFKEAEPQNSLKSCHWDIPQRLVWVVRLGLLFLCDCCVCLLCAANTMYSVKFGERKHWSEWLCSTEGKPREKVSCWEQPLAAQNKS